MCRRGSLILQSSCVVPGWQTPLLSSQDGNAVSSQPSPLFPLQPGVNPLVDSVTPDRTELCLSEQPPQGASTVAGEFCGPDSAVPRQHDQEAGMLGTVLRALSSGPDRCSARSLYGDKCLEHGTEELPLETAKAKMTSPQLTCSMVKSWKVFL